jgi:nitrile hydratase
MDGVHDLGGKHGFGPIDRTHENAPYHGEADARAYALTVSLRGERGYPIDWFRHVRENIDPVDYLSRPYFDQWLQTAVAMAIDAGDLTMVEVATGKATALDRTPAPMDVAAVRTMLTTPADFEREGSAPAFEVSARVRTASHGHAGHTRLPAYARGATGTIIAYRGAHLMPDDGAKGVDRAEPLYTVAFARGDLFPEAAGSPDRVHLDLWESYLAPV